jgi:hypothetical protein
MKSQLQNQETRLPAQPGAETSRIAAAISRILLIHRVTAQNPGVAPAALSDDSTPSRQLDATPVEWALRMMF